MVVATGRAAGAGPVTLRFTAKARSRLRRARDVNVGLSVQAADAAGNVKRADFRVRLTRTRATLRAVIA